jgi:hypothetical protein
MYGPTKPTTQTGSTPTLLNGGSIVSQVSMTLKRLLSMVSG